MTDENETVHQIELEMQRLMKIINGDQEIISKKNNEISELHSLLKSKETEIRLVRKMKLCTFCYNSCFNIPKDCCRKNL